MKRIAVVGYPATGLSLIRRLVIDTNLKKHLFLTHDGFNYNSHPSVNYKKHLLSFSDHTVTLARNPADTLADNYNRLHAKVDLTPSQFALSSRYGAPRLKSFLDLWSKIVLHKNLLVLTYNEVCFAPQQTIDKLSDKFDLPKVTINPDGFGQDSSPSSIFPTTVTQIIADMCSESYNILLAKADG